MKQIENGLIIREVMAAKKMTYQDIADKINAYNKAHGIDRTMTQAAVGARVTGNPTISNLREIAMALDVKVTELFPMEERAITQYAPSENEVIICPKCGQKFSLHP